MKKEIPVGAPVPLLSGAARAPDKNCLSFWFPPIEAAGLPVPRTKIVSTTAELAYLLDGELPPAGWPEFLAELTAAGDEIGWPAFLRTGHLSGKHEWNRTCFVSDRRNLGAHVSAIVEWSHLVDIMGLPTTTWAIRQMLDTAPLFRCEGYGGFPVVREFRYFVRDGVVEHVQPYWPPDAVRDGRPDWENWEADLADAADLTSGEQQELGDLAEAACKAVGGGYWSADFLEDRRGGWWLTDMALGDRSFKWERGA